MSAELTRARLLRDHGRHDEAVAMLLSHLSHFPEDPEAFVELALNRLEIPGQLANALEDARQATGMMPENPYPMALQARILCRMDRHKEALPLSESAIAMDPDCDFAWVSKCISLIGLSRWKDAEEAARKALEIDPDDESASNLLAHTLRLQNRLQESEDESRRRLARNPENAFSFANSGWAALQRGQVQEAEKLFLEALRLDPQMEYARDGLKHSYRARSGFFRLYLKWSFFITRFSEKNRFAIVIGLIIGFKVLRALFAAVHPLLVIPLAFVYYLFVFGSFLASGLANLFLLSDSKARMSLDRGEKAEGVALGLLFLGGVAVAVTGLALEQIGVAILGAAMTIAALPASMVFTNPSVAGRVVFSLLALTVVGCGAVMALDISTHPGRPMMEGLAGGCFTIGVFAGVGSTWLSAVPSLRNAKER